ncbi:unnamed protein product [Paramecium primaurelia]|uniref:Uncharacterized protein n=1 Tax=Paramecium primaurelia TaxID=5886 RepID=A0A8S1PJD5_PARPR|nr:unnamed protein product [Paramecium primaurelia]
MKIKNWLFTSIFQLFRAVKQIFQIYIIWILNYSQIQTITQNQVQELQTLMAFDQAISYDCITHQMIKNYNWNLLRDAWGPEIFQVNKKLEWVRLISLKKVHPKIPTSEQFRPLVILSPLFKFIKLRFFKQLKDYMIHGIIQE